MRSKLKECKNSHEDLRFKVERLRADISQLREILKDLSNNHQNNDNAVQEAIEKFEEWVKTIPENPAIMSVAVKGIVFFLSGGAKSSFIIQALTSPIFRSAKLET